MPAKRRALEGCGFGPGPAPGELILHGSREAAALLGDPGHRPGRAGGRKGPGSSVSKRLSQSRQRPLCAQKARLEPPSGEDARLCGHVFPSCWFSLGALLLYIAEKVFF